MQPPILIATQCFPPDVGGIETLMGQLADAFVARGHTVVALADATKNLAPRHDTHAALRTGGKTQADADAQRATLTVHRYGGPKLLRRRLKALGVSRHLATTKYGGLFCDSWKSLELLHPVGCPVAVQVYGMEIPPAPTAWKQHRMRSAFAKADTVVAISAYAAEQVAPYLGRSARLEVINPPILPQPGEDLDQVAALRSGLGTHTHLIAGMARLEPRKGFDRVIAAMPALADRFPGAVLAIAGGGADRDRLEACARNAGVADKVHLLGRIDEAAKAALMAAADVFAMPVRREGASVEGYGLVFLEAAWYGTPSIAGADGGARDAVVDGETGLVVDGTDQAAVTAALARLLNDQDERARMGQAAKARVRQSFLWPQRIDAYAAALGL